MIKTTKMKDKITKVRTQVEQIIDHDTGELIDVNVKHIEILTDPDTFSLVYAGFWDVLENKNMSKPEVELFAYFAKNYGDGTPFTVNKYIRNVLATRSGRNEATYKQYVSKLKQKNLIIKVAANTYVVSPKYVYRGSSRERNKLVVTLVSNATT